MSGTVINIQNIEMISLHFKGGLSRIFKREDIVIVAKKIILPKSFLFAVINLSGCRLPLIVRDAEELLQLIKML